MPTWTECVQVWATAAAESVMWGSVACVGHTFSSMAERLALLSLPALAAALQPIVPSGVPCAPAGLPRPKRGRTLLLSAEVEAAGFREEGTRFSLQNCTA